jgi:glutathione S-transferase
VADLTIFIGNKAYSSWSLRAWLALEHASRSGALGAPYKEVIIPLAPPGTRTVAAAAHSPSGKVPALRDGDLVVWDSLAICEYIAEAFPSAKLWPEDRAARAVARSVSAEMHSGFAALRSHMTMNVRRDPIVLPPTPEVSDEVARVQALWADCRTRFGKGGPFLFGRFSIADAMFAPVATRFRTYGVPLDDAARAYVDAIYATPEMQNWIADAKRETWAIEVYEKVGK